VATVLAQQFRNVRLALFHRHIPPSSGESSRVYASKTLPFRNWQANGSGISTETNTCGAYRKICPKAREANPRGNPSHSLPPLCKSITPIRPILPIPIQKNKKGALVRSQRSLFQSAFFTPPLPLRRSSRSLWKRADDRRNAADFQLRHVIKRHDQAS